MQETGKTYAGRYKLEAEVGRGGMAVVYRGFDQRVKRRVAVKVLYPYLALKEENKLRFQREAQVAAKLDHRNIVRVYDYSGLDSDENYIVGEFVEGNTLKRFMADTPLSLPEAGAMMVHEIASALEHAHRKGVIHRDVKPENVMINEQGVLKLMDFGIATMKDMANMTVTGTMIGSPSHMSPEHIEGRALDPRADIFSLGTVLYTLCVGTLPFEAPTAHSLFKKILDVEYRPALHANPAVGETLSAIIDRCLRKDPDERYQSCEHLRLDLQSHLEALGFAEPSRELALLFKNPALYQERGRARVIEQELLDARRLVRDKRLGEALRHYDRALCLDGERDDIVAEIEAVRHRVELGAALKRYVLPVLALALLGLGGFWGARHLGLVGAGTENGAPGGAPVLREATRERPRLKPPAGRPAVREEALESGADVILEPVPEAELRASGEEHRRGETRLRSAAEMPPLVEFQPRTRPVPEGLRHLRVRLPRPTAEALRVARDNVRPERERPERGTAEDAGGENGGTGEESVEPGGPDAATTRVPVTIEAFPPAAEIWVDGKRVGMGRVSGVELLPGEHTLRLHHPSCDVCEDVRRDFTVTADGAAPRLRERIGFKPAVLRVVAPASGLVFVNGELAGRTNEAITLRTRTHMPWKVRFKVLFDDPSLGAVEESGILRAGRETKVNVRPPGGS